jgi:hypothetical protein
MRLEFKRPVGSNIIIIIDFSFLPLLLQNLLRRVHYSLLLLILILPLIRRRSTSLLQMAAADQAVGFLCLLTTAKIETSMNRMKNLLLRLQNKLNGFEIQE